MAKSSESSSYTGKNVDILEGLSGAYTRPGMYIGDTGKYGFHHLLWEVVNNSLDEAMGGFCQNIDVTLNPDNSVTVVDDGRGIPVDMKQLQSGEEKPTVEILFTHLHSGAKFDSDSYKYSGGLHGVGISVVNALSDFVNVEIKRDRKVYGIGFAFKESIKSVNGEDRVVPEPGVCVKPLETVGVAAKDESGTSVTFRPNSRGLFEATKWDKETIKERLKLYAHVVPGISISFTDMRSGDNDESIIFHYEDGLNDLIDEVATEVAGYEEDGETYFDVMLENGNLGISAPILNRTGEDGSQEEIGELQFYAQWTFEPGSNIRSIVNAIPTNNGGTHVSAVQSVLVRTINRVAKETNLLDSDERVKWEDVSHGLIGVINVYLANPEFESQVKGKLGGGLETSQNIQSAANRALSQWAIEHPAEMRDVAEHAVSHMRVREKRAEEDKERNKKENRGAESSSRVPSKLKDCRNHGENSELIIVEGDSAGKNVNLKRDDNYQALLPLKGKIRNLVQKNLNADSEGIVHIPAGTIADIVNALGCGTEERFDPDKLRYGRVVLMTDADDDGKHIALLLLGVIYTLMPELIYQGRVYEVKMPLFSGKYKNEVVFTMSLAERRELEEKNPRKKYNWKRFKGLGQMNSPELYQYGLNPETRVLKRVTVDHAKQAAFSVAVNSTLGKDSDIKWKIIQSMQETNGSFPDWLISDVFSEEDEKEIPELV